MAISVDLLRVVIVDDSGIEGMAKKDCVGKDFLELLDAQLGCQVQLPHSTGDGVEVNRVDFSIIVRRAGLDDPSDCLFHVIGLDIFDHQYMSLDVGLCEVRSCDGGVFAQSISCDTGIGQGEEVGRGLRLSSLGSCSLRGLNTDYDLLTGQKAT